MRQRVRAVRAAAEVVPEVAPQQAQSAVLHGSEQTQVIHDIKNDHLRIAGPLRSFNAQFLIAEAVLAAIPTV